jgi:hypothetical protein
MKTQLLLFVATALSAQAAQIQFALSPPGTDVATGISWQNEVPPPTNSTGTGNTIGGGIVYNTDTSILHIEIGYGSAAGFSDLSGIPTGMHIHCPAPVGSNAAVLVNLLPYNIATNPAHGGLIIGDVPYPTNSAASLLAGLNYINIHTSLNPGGEVRGQLIAVVAPTNVPPSITCPANSTVECGTSSTVTVLVSDANNDALTVTWSLNGTVVQTNALAAGGTAASTAVSFSSTAALGTNMLSVIVTDSAGNSAACVSTVTVVDTTPPVIQSIQATPNALWPPNHKMITIHVSANVTDTCGPATWKIISVSSNESISGKGNPHKSSAWKITGDHTLQLRAERNGNGNGRVYTITIQATDASGNTSLGTVTVAVPHDQGHGNQNQQGNKGDDGDKDKDKPVTGKKK